MNTTTNQKDRQNMLAANQQKVAGLLDKMKPQMLLCLPKHMSVDRLCRIALTELRKTPMLQECDPMSFIAAVMQASQLGLEIGVLGSCYIVPFRNHKKNTVECNFIPGYRGLIDLSRRSGAIVSINAEIVYQNDHFEYEKGLESKLVHKPVLVNRGAMIAAYAVAKLKDGGHQFLVMSKEEIDMTKARAKSQSGPWVTDFEAMAQKTVVRRLFKWLPCSVEMQKAAVLDEHAEVGIQDIKAAVAEDLNVEFGNMFEGEVVDHSTGEVTSQADELAAQLKPVEMPTMPIPPQLKGNPAAMDQLVAIRDLLKEKNVNYKKKEELLKKYGVDDIAKLNDSQAEELILTIAGLS